MRIGLLLQRATDLKWAGPFAEEALGAKHQVTLFALEGQGSAKGYLSLSEHDCGELLQAGAHYAALKTEQIDSHTQLTQQDALLMLEGFHTQQANLEAWRSLRAKGPRLISLPHFFEICKRPLEALDDFDATLYVSQYARDLHIQIQGEGAQKSQPALGSPMFDQLKRVSREQSRKEIGIAKQERVVLLMAPVILPTTPWRFHVWRDASRMTRLKDAFRAREFAFLGEILFGHTFRQLFEAIAVFCQRNEARLIVKSRGKQKNLDFVAESSDFFFDGLDDEYFPLFSSYKLMAAADLCITVNSMAAAEAVALGRPCVNIYVPYHDRAAASTPQKQAYNRELLGGAPASIMNYAGAVRQVDRRKALKFFGGDWEQLSFTPGSSEEYARHFLGIEPGGSASRRILDYMEAAA